MGNIAGSWAKETPGRYHVGEFGRFHYTHVYAVTPRGGGECIKFGRAANVKRRLSGIQTGSPVKLVLLGSVFVPWEVEPEIHTYLNDHRSHGEWFYPTVQVTKIGGLCT